jgi:hypothetical protein
MAKFWGLGAIPARMGVSKTTILAWLDRYAFPIYLRDKGPRKYWWTDDALILRWHFIRVEVERRVRRQRRAGRSAQ